jgi:hypothetical protein
MMKNDDADNSQGQNQPFEIHIIIFIIITTTTTTIIIIRT